LTKFKLTLHPEKTRMQGFGRFAKSARARRRGRKPETFTFLGFTRNCAEDRNGRFPLQRHSRRDRLRATLARIKLLLQRRMH